MPEIVVVNNITVTFDKASAALLSRALKDYIYHMNVDSFSPYNSYTEQELSTITNLRDLLI
jgi:hypothetical protein